MATTQFAFGLVPNGLAPAMRGADTKNTSVETKTPSGTTSATTAAASTTTGNNQAPICRIATDTLVYVSFGSAPNAQTDTVRFMVPAGGIEYFYVNPGDKAAVVTAP